MEGWTDYPLIELGDKPGEPAPIRKVKILSYDGDKYCKVNVGGHTFSIKCGYLYRRESRYGTGFPLRAEVDRLLEEK